MEPGGAARSKACRFLGKPVRHRNSILKAVVTHRLDTSARLYVEHRHTRRACWSWCLWTNPQSAGPIMAGLWQHLPRLVFCDTRCIHCLSLIESRIGPGRASDRRGGMQPIGSASGNWRGVRKSPDGCEGRCPGAAAGSTTRRPSLNARHFRRVGSVVVGVGCVVVGFSHFSPNTNPLMLQARILFRSNTTASTR